MADLVLPPPLFENPAPSQWLDFSSADVVKVRPGRVEIGQGILTIFGQLARHELEVDQTHLLVEPVSTAHSPNEGYTAGSRSIEQGGLSLRHACAEARERFRTAAAARLGVETSDVSLENGVFSAGDGPPLAYWDLVGEVDLDTPVSGEASLRPDGEGGYLGASTPRDDLPERVKGRSQYVQNLSFPDMVHARVVRPPSPWARLVSIDEDTDPGITVAREGSFVAVMAEREDVAIAASERLAESATWKVDAPTVSNPHEFRELPNDTEIVEEATLPALPDDGCSLSHSYSRPFIAHASIGPSCAVAQWQGDDLTVWSPTQGVFPLQDALARAFDIPADQITVHYAQGAGCYGHNGADDVSYEAALVARHSEGRPVRLQWTRADEFSRAPVGPATLVEMEAQLDGDGRIASWRHEMWGNGHGGRPGRPAPAPAFASAPLVNPEWAIPDAATGGMPRNSDPLYDVGPRQIVAHRLHDMPLRTSSLRSLGAHANVFALESFMDELAAEVGADPVEFRLDHLSDSRARAVIEEAATRAEWGSEVDDSYGRGLGFARYKNAAGYCAVVAIVEAETELRVQSLQIVVDVGFAINPDGVRNQVEGGAIQATSWTLKEQVHAGGEGITSTGWESYPILRFSEVPTVDVAIIPRDDMEPLGAGEIAQGPTSAAIANALFDALGLRIRDLPITQDRILAAI